MSGGVIGTLSGKMNGRAWTATLTASGWRCDDEMILAYLNLHSPKYYKAMIDPMDQRAWGVGALIWVGEKLKAVVRINAEATQDRQSSAKGE